MIFVLIKRKKPDMVCWFEARVRTKEELKSVRYDSHGCSDIKLENESGGYNYLIKSDVILEIVEGKNWNVIEGNIEHRQKTSFYQSLLKNSKNKSLKIGWLSPSGEMHYCEYHDHISYVHEILDSDVPTIEKQGWLHIRKMDDGEPYFSTNKRITQDQARTLREELGVRVFDEQIMYQ